MNKSGRPKLPYTLKQRQIRAKEEAWRRWQVFAYTKLAMKMSDFIRKALDEYVDAYEILKGNKEDFEFSLPEEIKRRAK